MLPDANNPAKSVGHLEGPGVGRQLLRRSDTGAFCQKWCIIEKESCQPAYPWLPANFA
jgi:hypothetical protein